MESMSVHSRNKVKFATQADPHLLSELRTMARSEGRLLQTLIDEALREYVGRKQGLTPRVHVHGAFDESLAQYDDLYRRLAE
jgi:hypothetical protein